MHLQQEIYTASLNFTYGNPARAFSAVPPTEEPSTVLAQQLHQAAGNNISS